MKFKQLLIQILLLPVLPCFFKGPDPSEFNQPTDAEKAAAEVAAKQWNAYLAGKPMEMEYLADVSQDPMALTEAAKGKAAVDLSGMTAKALGNTPNVTGDGAGMMRLSAQRAKIGNELGQDAISQQAAGRKSYIENAMGMQSTANTAQAGLAADAVARNTSQAEADYTSSAANAGAFAGMAGAAAGAGRAYLNSKGGQR